MSPTRTSLHRILTLDTAAAEKTGRTPLDAMRKNAAALRNAA